MGQKGHSGEGRGLLREKGLPGGKKRVLGREGPHPLSIPSPSPQNPVGKQVTWDEASGPGSLRVWLRRLALDMRARSKLPGDDAVPTP